MKIVVGAQNQNSAFQYCTMLHQLGFDALAVNATAPLLACIHDPRSVLLLLEDGFSKSPSTSVHALIDQIRCIPGPKANIPIIRVWTGLVIASTGKACDSLESLRAPVNSFDLLEAMRRLGIKQQGQD